MAPTLTGISRLEAASDAESCAHLMTTSEPWLTLGRTYEASLRIVQDPAREVYVARDDEGLAGFLILCMFLMPQGFVGLVRSVQRRLQRGPRPRGGD